MNPSKFICCDLPYGTTSIKWDTVLNLDGLWKHYNRIIKPKGVICLFGSQPFSSRLICSNLECFRYELIWNKNNQDISIDIERETKKLESIYSKRVADLKELKKAILEKAFKGELTSAA